MNRLFGLLTLLLISESSLAQLSYLRGPRKNFFTEFSIQNDLQDNKNQSQTINGKLSFYALKSKKTKLFFMGDFNTFDYGGRGVLRVGEQSTPIDSHLFDQNMGVSFSRSLNDKGKSAGFSLNFGSSSDSPFGKAKNNALTFNAFYTLNKSRKSQWFFILNYSNNRTFLKEIPLPSLGYFYQPHKNFNAFLGLPFAVLTWVNFPNYLHNIVLTPGSLKADFSWSVWGPIRFYSLFDYRSSSYMHQKRVREELRLYVEEKKLQLGLRGPISRKLSLEIGLGYGFDRKIFEGESLFKAEGEKISLDDQPYAFFEFKLDL